MNEIIFSCNNQRCHAKTVTELSGKERFIGKLDGYEIYRLPGVFFDQFGFVAVK